MLATCVAASTLSPGAPERALGGPGSQVSAIRIATTVCSTLEILEIPEF
jgi:hypothetical protein